MQFDRHRIKEFCGTPDVKRPIVSLAVFRGSCSVAQHQVVHHGCAGGYQRSSDSEPNSTPEQLKRGWLAVCCTSGKLGLPALRLCGVALQPLRWKACRHALEKEPRAAAQPLSCALLRSIGDARSAQASDCRVLLWRLGLLSGLFIRA